MELHVQVPVGEQDGQQCPHRTSSDLHHGSGMRGGHGLECGDEPGEGSHQQNVVKSEAGGGRLDDGGLVP